MNPSLAERLAEPFASQEVKWKAQVVRSNRALAVAYIDARAVEDRLDAIFGVDGWQDAYHPLPNGNVVCKLRVRINNDWIEKSDVGSQSDQPDEGDRTKSAFSDALKRTAVKLGIGRYLYRLPQQWVEYDPNTRKLLNTPRLPGWACPKGDTQSPCKQDRQSAKAPEEAADELISREQWEQIKDNLLQNRVLIRKLLDHFQVQKPRELPASRFDEALQLSSQPPKDWLPDTAAAA